MPNPIALVIRSYLKACSQLKITRSTADPQQFRNLVLLTFHHLQIYLKGDPIALNEDLVPPASIGKTTLSSLNDLIKQRSPNHPRGYPAPCKLDPTSQALLLFQRFLLLNADIRPQDTASADDCILPYLSTNPKDSEFSDEEKKDIKVIDLSHIHLGYDEDEFNYVLTEISRYPCEELNLSNCRFDNWHFTEGKLPADALQYFLVKENKLRVLKIFHSPLLIAGVARSIIQFQLSLEELHLADNEMSPYALDELLIALARNPPQQLKSLTITELHPFLRPQPHPLSLQSFYLLARFLECAPKHFQRLCIEHSQLTPYLHDLLLGLWKKTERTAENLKLGPIAQENIPAREEENKVSPIPAPMPTVKTSHPVFPQPSVKKVQRSQPNVSRYRSLTRLPSTYQEGQIKNNKKVECLDAQLAAPKQPSPVVPLPAKPVQFRAFSTFHQAVKKCLDEWNEKHKGRCLPNGDNTPASQDLIRQINYLSDCIFALRASCTYDDTILVHEVDALCTHAFNNYVAYQHNFRDRDTVNSLVNSLHKLLNDIFSELPLPKASDPSLSKRAPSAGVEVKQEDSSLAPVHPPKVQANLSLGPFPSQQSNHRNIGYKSYFRYGVEAIFEKYPNVLFDHKLKPWLKSILMDIANYLKNNPHLTDDSRLVVHLYYLFYNHPKYNTHKPPSEPRSWLEDMPSFFSYFHANPPKPIKPEAPSETLCLFDDITTLMRKYREGREIPHFYYSDSTHEVFLHSLMRAIAADSLSVKIQPPASALPTSPAASRQQLQVIAVNDPPVPPQKTEQERLQEFQQQLFKCLNAHWDTANMLVMTSWVKMDKSQESPFTLDNFLKLLVSSSSVLKSVGGVLTHLIHSENFQEGLAFVKEFGEHLETAESFKKFLERTTLSTYVEKVWEVIKEVLDISNPHQLEPFIRLITSSEQISRLAYAYRQVCEEPLTKLDPASIESVVAFLTARTIKYLVDTKNKAPVPLTPSVLLYGVMKDIYTTSYPHGDKVKLLSAQGSASAPTATAQQFFSLQGIMCRYNQTDIKINFKVERKGKNGVIVQTQGTLYGYRYALDEEVNQIKAGIKVAGGAIQCQTTEYTYTYTQCLVVSDQAVLIENVLHLHPNELKCVEIDDHSLQTASHIDEMVRENLKNLQQKNDELLSIVKSLKSDNTDLKKEIKDLKEDKKELIAENKKINEKFTAIQRELDEVREILGLPKSQNVSTPPNNANQESNIANVTPHELIAAHAIATTVSSTTTKSSSSASPAVLLTRSMQNNGILQTHIQNGQSSKAHVSLTSPALLPPSSSSHYAMKP